jgi:glycosyltransferase involved in cell wall biosynthesis
VRIVFATSCPSPWGGSEELWEAAAQRLLDEPANRIGIAKPGLEPNYARFQALADRGAHVWKVKNGAGPIAAVLTSLLRVRIDGLRLTAVHFALLVIRFRPSLVVISQGEAYDGMSLVRVCRVLDVPYIVITHKASETLWPADAWREIYRANYAAARRVAFVSQHNLELTQDQLGLRIPTACVLSNPVPTGRQEGPLPWPDDSPTGLVRLACVARLFPAEKGQDTLLRILSQDRWRERPILLTLYGIGQNQETLQGMATHLGLTNVRFAGQASDVLEVWRTEHALVLPSRAEGLPLALVEAMMCGRPVIVSNAGGNGELVDDDRTGFLAAGTEAAAFEEALERAWQRRAEWPQIGLRAAEDIRRRVSADPAGDLADVIKAEAGPARFPLPTRLRARARGAGDAAIDYQR